jgi:zinc protease
MTWQSPKHFAPGDAELDLLATILATGKASRLYQALVYEQKIAQNVEASQASGVLGSRFQIGVLARPGVSLDRIEAAIDKELAKLRKDKPSDEELTRAKNAYEAQFIKSLESVRQRASILNLYEAELGDPGYVQKDLDRYRKVTADGIRAECAKVVDLDKRVILRIVPRKEKKQGEKK